MKILLLGDASNYHVSLAHGLRKCGHQVTVASAGSKWMNTPRDIDISRPFAGRIGGAILYARFLTTLAPKLKGYDAVHLVAPTFAELKPRRLMEIFRRLKANNGAVYLNYLGTDSTFVKTLTGPDSPLAYSEWSIEGKPTAYSMSEASEKRQWLAPELADYTDYIFDNVDGVTTALYEYARVLETARPDVRTVYAGIPVCTDLLPVPQYDTCAPVRTLYAAHSGREEEKGSRQILKLLRRLQAEHPGLIELIEPSNMPYARFEALLASVQLVADQIFSYTPATTALLSMALGAVPISGGEDDYYRFIDEPVLRPIINLRPYDDTANYALLEQVLTNPELFGKMRRQGREFVEKHNDSLVVARRFEQLYNH